jgi:serine/threonine-protein kinase
MCTTAHRIQVRIGKIAAASSSDVTLTRNAMESTPTKTDSNPERELNRALTKVLPIDTTKNPKASLETILNEYPQWAEPITESWNMHQQLSERKASSMLPIPSRIGNYEILAELDRGGMGVVYRARHKELNRIVALKIIRSGELADIDEIARFRREAEVAAKLVHPGIIPIYEVGQEAHLVYYTMAFVQGQSLAAFKNASRISPRAAAAIVRNLTHALAYAHAQGIAHRDIKPSNILLDEHGNPILIDFGLAKMTHLPSELTNSGCVLGTPAYMAPEQIQSSRNINALASDIYSLGSVLYFLLSGRDPFAGSTFDILLQAKDREPTPPSRLNREVDRELDAICARAMEKNPKQRYQSIGELGDDLGRWIEGRAIQTPTKSLAMRCLRWWRQEPGLVTHVIAIAAVIPIVLLSHFLDESNSNQSIQLLLLSSWLVLCLPLQRWVLREIDSWFPAVTWGILDVLFVTALIANAEAPRSLLLIAYPLMVVASALFYRTLYLTIMTIACVIGFFVLAYTVDDPSMARRDFQLIYLTSLAVLGLTLNAIISRIRNVFLPRLL